MAEGRCEGRSWNKKELQGIQEMEDRPVLIETEEEYDARVFAEEAEAARLAEEEEKEKEEAAQRKKEAEEKKKALQEEKENEDKKEEEEPANGEGAGEGTT